MRDSGTRGEDLPEAPDGAAGPEPADPGAPDWDAEDWEARAERGRARRLRRIRRQRIVFATLVVLVLAAGVVAALIATGRWEPGEDPAATAGPTCSGAAPPAAAAPAEVRVQVLNSTDRQGLAGSVAAELRQRGFTVTLVDNADGGPVPEPAAVRYAPPALPAALAVASRVPGAVLVADPAAPEVALVLGTAYAQLAPEEALVPVPAPPGAAGCTPGAVP
ncbi:LytR C-terminal domain-containing protein [Kineococcus glutinatus]|uniref:LytR/CpsA/Psr regulator C-terminal domain-containing protein n=1 Tax=Kineococcus glutinatus TaxID=1070872 RepID=A0ABP9HWY2_9ACTN